MTRSRGFARISLSSARWLHRLDALASLAASALVVRHAHRHATPGGVAGFVHPSVCQGVDPTLRDGLGPLGSQLASGIRSIQIPALDVGRQVIWTQTRVGLATGDRGEYEPRLAGERVGHRDRCGHWLKLVVRRPEAAWTHGTRHHRWGLVDVDVA